MSPSSILQVHQFLQLMKAERGDADSTSSGEGSNTDSGRGPSEEGDRDHSHSKDHQATRDNPQHHTSRDHSHNQDTQLTPHQQHGPHGAHGHQQAHATRKCTLIVFSFFKYFINMRKYNRPQACFLCFSASHLTVFHFCCW